MHMQPISTATLAVASVAALSLGGCSSDNDSHGTNVTSAQATNLAHEMKLGEPIHVDKCDGGTDCDVDITMTNVEASFTCEDFFREHTNNAPEGKAFVTLTGTVDVKQSTKEFGIEDTDFVGLDSDNKQTTESNPAPNDCARSGHSLGTQVGPGMKNEGEKTLEVPTNTTKIRYKPSFFKNDYYTLDISHLKLNSVATNHEQKGKETDLETATNIPTQKAPAVVSTNTQPMREDSGHTSNPAQGGSLPDCPAYQCVYGSDENGKPYKSSGETQLEHLCQQGVVTDPEQCGKAS